ncbi:uncharacterized protein LOC132200892 [Neocloeon triangulifer]|uniref:uncharacterized protein LOC132200892 n=1 Tax=Neocloeon triangulifer TaxID=2078957 RepID=UPI00286EB779|nr:uncharacterized protein LOC132200892 [Neocloeon triangulifer]
MGCGRSRLQIFQSTSSSKKKKKKKEQHDMVVESVDNLSIEDASLDFNSDSPEAASARRAAAVARFRQISQGPLLAMAEVSKSQTDFFRMLDEKIESGPDFVDSYEDRRTSNSSLDPNKLRRLSLISNGHKTSVSSIKFHSQGFLTSSPTRARTPQPNVSPKHRLPPLQASPPPRDGRRSSPTHILSLALSSPLKNNHGSPRMFGTNKVFKSEELASRYD